MRRPRRLILPTAALLLAGLPAFAVPKPAPTPSFQLRSPGPGAYGGEVVIRWRWTGPRAVRNALVSLSAVDAAGTSTVISESDRTWHGASRWDTRGWTDGTYTISGHVIGFPDLASDLPGVIVDNTAPVASITKPAAGQLVIADNVLDASAISLDKAIVVGPVTLTAAVTDADPAPSVIWFLGDGEERREIGEGTAFTYNFPPSQNPHHVSIEAVDWVGNASSAHVDVLGASPEVPNPTNPAQCVADQVSAGTVPPDPTCVPVPTPTEIPNPVPTDVPDPSCVADSMDPTCVTGPVPVPTDVPSPIPSDIPDPSDVPNPAQCLIDSISDTMVDPLCIIALNPS